MKTKSKNKPDDEKSKTISEKLIDIGKNKSDDEEARKAIHKMILDVSTKKPHDEKGKTVFKMLFDVAMLVGLVIMERLKSMFNEGLTEPSCVVFKQESTLCLAFAASGEELKLILPKVSEYNPFIIEGAKDFSVLKNNNVNPKMETVAHDMVANSLVTHFGLAKHPEIKVVGYNNKNYDLGMIFIEFEYDKETDKMVNRSAFKG